MRYLRQQEKILLVLLIVAALVALVVSVYLGINNPSKEKEQLNNRIRVIHTGGEIEPNFKEQYDKHKDKTGQYDIQVYNPTLNSSDIVPNDWNVIAEDIGKSYNKYDAFVIVCGKDTLAYTASALSFMLENLGKPVVVTDGQLASALVLASTTRIPEVMVASRDKLLRACRAVHKSTEYFTSPNYEDLKPYNSFKTPQHPMEIKFVSPKVKVIVIKVFPGMDHKHILSLLNDTGIHGVVLETYGVGRGPTSEKFLNAINRVAKRGVVIVAVSQCSKTATPDLDPRLMEAGVLSGRDITTPAAFAKLCYLLGNVREKQLLGKLMEQSFRGEMTLPLDK
jgi:L-asparaginase